MKKLFPVLLVLLSILALSHFVKKEKPVETAKFAEKASAVRSEPTAPVRQEQSGLTGAPAQKEKLNDLLSANLPQPEQRTIGFHEKIDNFFMKTPRLDSLKALLPSEIHDTPAPVLQAGRDLGEMREYFLTHHHDINVELSFYLKCSQQKDFFDSARALCAARASQLFLKMTGRTISPKIFDDRIAALKDQITL